jgi:5'-deoxynucleotidase YfbR-like HD superfamily hydrolase
VEPGPFIQTVSGRRVNPFEPNLDDLEIGDIANALANQCRFGGHCFPYLSVAQHSCVVADLVLERGGTPEDALWALLHDASEAYLVDLPHPIKHRSELGRLYAEAEKPLQDAIIARFGLTPEAPASLKPLDRAVLATERRAVSDEAWHWPELDGFEALDLEIEPWPPERARDEFLARFARLEAARAAASA